MDGVDEVDGVDKTDGRPEFIHGGFSVFESAQAAAGPKRGDQTGRAPAQRAEASKSSALKGRPGPAARAPEHGNEAGWA
jgi:hypothetical protein